MKAVKKNRIVKFEIDMIEKYGYVIRVTRQKIRSKKETKKVYSVSSVRRLVCDIPYDMTVEPLTACCDIYEAHNHWYLFPSFVIERKQK